MNPTHRTPVHGDPELARGQGRKGQKDPSTEGPALVIKDRRATAFMPTEAVRAPEVPAAFKVIEKRASTGVEDPKEATPAPAPTVTPAEAAADAAANADSPVAAPTVPHTVQESPAAGIAGAVAAVEGALATPTEEVEAPTQGAKPKRSGVMGAINSTVDFVTSNLPSKAKVGGLISACVAVAYQIVDNAIELAAGRAAGDALVGIVTDITSGFWNAVKWVGEKITSSPGWAISAGIGVAGVWTFKNVRNFIRSWKNISGSEEASYGKAWNKISESFSLAWKLTKTAFVSLFICHLPSLVAKGSEIVAVHKEMKVFENIKHGIDMFFKHAPAAAWSLFVLAGVGVAWFATSAGIKKLFDMHQDSKNQKAANEERNMLIAEQLALRVQEELDHEAEQAAVAQAAAQPIAPAVLSGPEPTKPPEGPTPA